MTPPAPSSPPFRSFRSVGNEGAGHRNGAGRPIELQCTGHGARAEEDQRAAVGLAVRLARGAQAVVESLLTASELETA